MNTLFRKSALAVLALTLAVPVAVSTSTSSQAGSRDAFVGGLLGGVVGGVIGSSQRSRSPEVIYVEPRRRVYREPVRPRNAHVNWCHNRYRSYSARSDTYVTYSGREKYCNSPYN